MSTARTKVFGMDLGVDPKVIALLLVIVAVAIYYFTSNSETTSTSSTVATPNLPVAVHPGPSLNARAVAARRANASRSDRGTLKLIAVDGSRGDVDPTLRLRLLDQVKNVAPATTSRNLFDSGNPETAQNLPPIPKNVPKLPPGPVAGSMVSSAMTKPPPPQFTIPLKYYGFVKPTGQATDGSRGFFMDGDNILVGAEGDLLEKKFLIVALTPGVARLEDTQAKQGQDLQVTPEAPISQ